MDERGPGPIDLIGGHFTVIESDPGVFTSLLHKLGVRGLEVAEVFDIDELCAGTRGTPRGLIFCYPCAADQELQGKQGDKEDVFDDTTPDPDAKDIWFAHQLCNDACATQAILNITFNLRDVRLEAELDEFKRDTDKMSPIMKGLALTNCSFIRDAHNSLARPVDIRGALHSAATTTLAYHKKVQKTRVSHSSPPKKRRKTTSKNGNQTDTEDGDSEDTYHYIGYVLIGNKVWELDGLRYAGPLEVGELPESPNDIQATLDWVKIVRPALQRRMQRLQEFGNIRYNLLGIVENKYESASDKLEMLKRLRQKIERRMEEEYPSGWKEKVDATLVSECSSALSSKILPGDTLGPTYGTEFASIKLRREMEILDMPVRKLPQAWEQIVRDAKAASKAVEDEVSTYERVQSDHVNRTFDYEPFIREFMKAMQAADLLDAALGDEKVATTSTSSAKRGRGRPKKS